VDPAQQREDGGGGVTELDLDEVLYVEENVVVADFPREMPVDGETFATVHERFAELVRRPEVDTHVTMLQMDDPLGSDVFEQGKEGVALCAEHGVTTWIAVSDDIKSMAVRSRLGAVDGVTVETADTRREAMAMAKG
jgi:hypothetical protein